MRHELRSFRHVRVSLLFLRVSAHHATRRQHEEEYWTDRPRETIARCAGIRLYALQAALAEARAPAHRESGGSRAWIRLRGEARVQAIAARKLPIEEGDSVNIDYMVCYRVAGEWKIEQHLRDR